MNIKTIKEKIRVHKYYLIAISILIIIIIIMLIALLNKEKTSFVNPYEVEVSPNDNFLFLGDSITDFYPLEEYYDDLPVVNSGISGNKTTDILNNMKERVYQYNPSKVFLLIGTNDLDSLDEDIVDITFNNIKEIIEEIKENRSKASIYVESIYPVNSNIENNTVSNRTNEKIKALNKKISKYCNDETCKYINLYNDLLDEEGNLKEEYTEDGLHLNSLGYVVITRELLPYMNE